MSEVKNILIVGVGGQGNLAASHILANAALLSGYDVKVAETHGMSQRGGSVFSMVRYGPKVFSPLIPEGKADLLVSLELMEGLRWLHYLAEDSKAVVSTEKRPITGTEAYPKNAREIYREKTDTVFIPAVDLAEQAGISRAANVVMLGAISTLLEGINEDVWREAIARRFKKKHVEKNIEAFLKGREYMLAGGDSSDQTAERVY